ncbi:hypothetical protein EDB83DRAFT_2669562 [Lactarius deliciosus]|nr:hypothetical protein EDB83DRAFT_2669562 [Lactarius deliciosus]
MAAAYYIKSFLLYLASTFTAAAYTFAAAAYTIGKSFLSYLASTFAEAAYTFVAAAHTIGKSFLSHLASTFAEAAYNFAAAAYTIGKSFLSYLATTFAEAAYNVAAATYTIGKSFLSSYLASTFAEAAYTFAEAAYIFAAAAYTIGKSFLSYLASIFTEAAYTFVAAAYTSAAAAYTIGKSFLSYLAATFAEAAYTFAAAAYTFGKSFLLYLASTFAAAAYTFAAAAYTIGKSFLSYLANTFAAAAYTISKSFLSYMASTLAAVSHAIGKYFFGGTQPPRYPYLASTLALTCTVVTAYAISTHFFSGKDNNPPRHSYYSSSSYISATTRTQTHQSYRPSPSTPSYTYRPPATNAYSQTTARTPAPPDYDCGVYHPSVASPSPYSQKSSQTQPSSTCTQTSHLYSSFFDTDHVHEPSEYEYSQTGSYVPLRAPTGSEPPPPTVAVSSDPCSDEPVGVKDLKLAKELREQARRKGREMSEARSRAKSATKKGRLGAARAHRQDVLARESEMKELDKRAAKIVFGENNKNCEEGGKIDLHGLHVPEAIQVAKDQLQTAMSRGDEIVYFIVGKGLHSDAGGAKIRPALEGFLAKRSLIHWVDPSNAGVLVVRLELLKCRALTRATRRHCRTFDSKL